jgi:6-pyruvoyltetrahydropterin/6-carboxytetrahydropterin synthase
MHELSIRTRFSAAHRLIDYEGNCASVHGHNWDVEVFVQGRRLDRQGLLVDFRKLKAAVKRVMDGLDHQDLNQHAAFRKRNPTSEHIAMFLYKELSADIDGARYRVSRVCVNETPDSRACYWER